MRIWIFVLGLCGAASLSTIRLPVMVYLQLDTGPISACWPATTLRWLILHRAG